MNRRANQLMNLVSHLTDRLVESNLAIGFTDQLTRTWYGEATAGTLFAIVSDW